MADEQEQCKGSCNTLNLQNGRSGRTASSSIMDSFPEKKEQHNDKGTPVNGYVEDDSEGGKPALRKRTIMWITAIFAVIALVVGGAILTATLLNRKEQVTERLVEVNLEPGETLLYQVEQVLEVRSGELQRGI